MANKGFKYFESQEPDEEIILIVRRHWFSLNAPLYIGWIIGIIGAAGYLFLNNNNFFSLKGLSGNLIDIISGMILIIFGTFIFTVWMINYMELLILTSKRIVAIEQKNLFSRKLSILDLDSIQDVSITEKGFIETIFGMGEVLIQTAGELPNFKYENLANPEEVQVMILKARENHLKGLKPADLSNTGPKV